MEENKHLNMNIVTSFYYTHVLRGIDFIKCSNVTLVHVYTVICNGYIRLESSNVM